MQSDHYKLNGRSDNDYIVTGLRFLTESAFVLQFTRRGMKFRAGQHLVAGIAGEMDQREYSIYSGENDASLEILVREVREGNISVKLSNCEPGQKLNVNGPFGSFGIEKADLMTKKHIFIASGTGISPFHSIVRSYPAIDYLLLHGVSYADEAYDATEYEKERYVLCTSREAYGGRQGRVTEYLKDFETNGNMMFYLCGNSAMIFDAKKMLKARGVDDSCIVTEVYF